MPKSKILKSELFIKWSLIFVNMNQSPIYFIINSYLSSWSLSDKPGDMTSPQVVFNILSFIMTIMAGSRRVARQVGFHLLSLCIMWFEIYVIWNNWMNILKLKTFFMKFWIFDSPIEPAGWSWASCSHILEISCCISWRSHRTHSRCRHILKVQRPSTCIQRPSTCIQGSAVHCKMPRDLVLILVLQIPIILFL